MSGETFDVGIDTCAPVGPYPPEFPFTGVIDKVEIDVATLMDELTPEQLQQLASGMQHAASSSQ